MNIIIVGDGKVGYTLAQRLSGEDNNIVIIDKNYEALRKASDMLDVLCVRGNGLNAGVLIEAGVETADLVVAATSRDEINMLCCMMAKKLGAKHTVARIRDPEYTQELTMLKNELEIDLVINPEQETAAEITRQIRFTNAANVQSFAHGKLEIIGFKVSEDDFICGYKLSKLTPKLGARVVFCAVTRGEETIIPNGDYTIEDDDLIYIIGEPHELILFFKTIKQYTEYVKNAVIIGGGHITYYLANLLQKAGIKLKIIEIDEDKCLKLCEALPGCIIINGDGTDEELLDAENIADSSAFIALTDRDEENLLSALYAAQLGIPKTIAKINKISYSGVLKNLGVESIVSPKNITTQEIVRYIRALSQTLDSEFETMYQIADGNAEIVEFTATRVSSEVLGKPLKNLKLKKRILVAAIIRRDHIIIPSGNDYIAKGDSVILVTKNSQMTSLKEILED